MKMLSRRRQSLVAALLGALSLACPWSAQAQSSLPCKNHILHREEARCCHCFVETPQAPPKWNSRVAKKARSCPERRRSHCDTVGENRF